MLLVAGIFACEFCLFVPFLVLLAIEILGNAIIAVTLLLIDELVRFFDGRVLLLGCCGQILKPEERIYFVCTI